MKKLLIIILFFSFINCDKNPISPDKKYFSPENLSKLALDSLEAFWQGDSITHISHYVTENFERHRGFLDALRYSVFCKEGLAVSVFKTKTMAIDAIEERKHEVQCLIRSGETNEVIKEKWWYSSCITPFVCINKNTTIVEAFFIAADYEKVKDLLIETTLEIASRVDSLSE
ncbi:hypothetical protein H8E88_16220 [candidate division KSB1 bacterium]|nr:hypothetical protein [candidate division KSB1 bacterium]